MTRFVASAWFLFVVMLTAFVFGCNSGTNGDRPQTYPVSGTVRLGDQPLEGATVNFQSADGVRSAVGNTDAQGRYQLMSFAPGDGALPGEYRVAITKYDVAAEEFLDDAEEEHYGPAIVPENLLPERYANPENSELTATVTEGDNTFDFELVP